MEDTTPIIEDPLGSVTRSKLHFFWLADSSGSMSAQGKIQALNNAIHECIPATRQTRQNQTKGEVKPVPEGHPLGIMKGRAIAPAREKAADLNQKRLNPWAEP